MRAYDYQTSLKTIILFTIAILSASFIIIYCYTTVFKQECCLNCVQDPVPCNRAVKQRDDEEDILGSLPQDDPRLIQIIRNWFLEPPPDPNTPYMFSNQNPELRGQIGVPLIVDQLLGEKSNGFYIECGAYDGESLTNSLFFEMERNWNGLLVEPNYIAFSQLKQKNRKAHILNACLTGNGKAETMSFVNAGFYGGLANVKTSESMLETREEYKQTPPVRTPCFPLYSVLLALGNPRVDYFSLDVEGAEWSIVKSIPWDKVDISVISLEHNHLLNKEELNSFMIAQGYEINQIVEWDTIFVKKGLKVKDDS